MAIESSPMTNYGMQAQAQAAEFYARIAEQKRSIQAAKEAQARQFGMGLLDKAVDFGLGTLERNQQFGMKKELQGLDHAFELDKAQAWGKNQTDLQLAKYNEQYTKTVGMSPDQVFAKLKEGGWEGDIKDAAELGLRAAQKRAVEFAALSKGKPSPFAPEPSAGDSSAEEEAHRALLQFDPMQVLSPNEGPAVAALRWGESLGSPEVGQATQQFADNWRKKQWETQATEYGLTDQQKGAVIDIANRRHTVNTNPNLNPVERRRGNWRLDMEYDAIRPMRVPKQQTPQDTVSSLMGVGKQMQQVDPNASIELGIDQNGKQFIRGKLPSQLEIAEVQAKRKAEDPKKIPLPEGTPPSEWWPLPHSIKFDYFEPRHKAAVEASKGSGMLPDDTEIWRQAQQDYENVSGLTKIHQEKFKREAMTVADALARGMQPDAAIVGMVKSGRAPLEAQQVVGEAIAIVSRAWTQRQESTQRIPQSQPTPSPSPDQEAGLPQQLPAATRDGSGMEDGKAYMTPRGPGIWHAKSKTFTALR